MATTQAYNNMLKRFLDQEMLTSEFAKENYIYKKMTKDLSWNGGIYEVPTEDGAAGSIAAGQLVDSADISMGKNSLGTIARDKEIWGAIKVNEADLSRHTSGKVSYIETILPDKVEKMIDRQKDQFITQVLTNGSLALVTANGTVGGVITVDKPELFTIGQLIEVFNGTIATKAFIKAININTGVLNLVTTNGGSTAVDVSAHTVALKSKIRIFGSNNEKMISLFDAVFPTSLGGTDVLYTLNKVDTPALQATFQDLTAAGAGAGAMTAANLLDKILAFAYLLKRQGRQKNQEFLVSYGVFKNLAIKLEANGRRYVVKDREAGYGFESVTFIGPEGDVKVTALKRLNDTEIYAVDWSGVKFAGSAMFETVKSPDGNRFYVERAATGYGYITDVKLAGEMVYSPSKLAGIKIDATVAA